MMAAVGGGGRIKRLSASPEVRFEAHYGLKSDIAPSPKSARNRSGTSHSITSSARPSSVGGILNPIVRAVLRLTLSRNLVGNSTGRSDGFLPLRILSTNVAHWPASAPMSAE